MQIRKEEIKTRILDAALETFAAKGFYDATMADIALAAGLSVGNLYLYYKNKADLLNSSITKEFIGELKELLSRKINLANGISLDNVKENHGYMIVSEEFLTFLCEKRLKIVILLETSNKALFPGIKEESVKYLNDLFEQYLKSIKSDFTPKEFSDIQPLIRIIYSSLIDSLVSVLKIYPNKDDLRLKLKKLQDYHLFGLNGLLR